MSDNTIISPSIQQTTNDSSQGEIHWLRLSIPFLDYQNILQPAGRSHTKIPSISSSSAHPDPPNPNSNPNPNPSNSLSSFSRSITGPSPIISTITEISTPIPLSVPNPLPTPLTTAIPSSISPSINSSICPSIYTTPIKTTNTTVSISKNVRPSSIDSMCTQSFDHNTNPNPISKLAITLPTIPADSSSLRYAYVTSATSPTNTMSDVNIEMESLDTTNHLRSPSGLSTSLHPSSPYSCPCQSCLIHTQPLSKQSVPHSMKMMTTTMGAKKGRTPSFGSRRVCPVPTQDNNNTPLSPISDMKVTSELDGLGGSEGESTIRSELSDIPLPINNIRGSQIQQPRRSSIFAGRGTYIDVEKSVMHFPSREFRPVIGPNRWNKFMFQPAPRRIFFLLYVFFGLAGLITTIQLDSMSITSMSIRVLVFCIIFCFIICMLLHWLDILVVLDLLWRWEVILCIIYNVIAIVTAIWRSLYDSTISQPLRVSNSCISNFSVAFGYLFLLFADACPRTLFPRWCHLCASLFVAFGELFIWISYGVLPSDEITSIPKICVFGCMSLSKMHSMAAANLSFFAFKFFLSLLIWPNYCVILKAKIAIEG